MHSWDCCRTCLGVKSLNPIFPEPKISEKYTINIELATGIKVEMNDNLPQEMCSTCIKAVNEVLRFRKQCQKTLTELLDIANTNKMPDRALHTLDSDRVIKKEETEGTVSIDVSDSDPFCNETHFADVEDDMPLEYLKNYKIVNFADVTVHRMDEKDVCNGPKKKKRVKIRSVKKKPDEKERQNDAVPKDAVEEGSKTENSIKCEYCHKILSSKTSLRNHYKIHTGFDVVCEHCGKKFITRRLLLMHCRAKHGYEKTDKCSFCDYKASNAEQVKIHERLHTGEKPFVCKECNAGFHRRSNYLQHIAIHLPEKTVQCDQCPALFKSVTLMRIHKSRHRLPTHKYKCAVCEAVFARRRNATRHLARIHAIHQHQGNVYRTSVK